MNYIALPRLLAPWGQILMKSTLRKKQKMTAEFFWNSSKILQKFQSEFMTEK